jgi:ABC-type branched-subunit amino acid transport system permease subunit
VRLRLRWVAAGLGLAAVALLLPAGVQCCAGNPAYLQQVIDLTAIFAIATLSMTLVSGVAGQLSLGQGGFMAIGAYGTSLLATRYGWPIGAAAAAACVLCGVVGVLVGLPALRLRGAYLVMATLAFAGITYGVVLNWTGLTGGPQGIQGIPAPAPFGEPIVTETGFYYLILVGLALAIAVVAVIRRGYRGLRMRALRNDELAAMAVGIRPAYERTVAFAVSAVLAGIAGSLLSVFVGYISPDLFTIDQSVQVLTMALFGGLTSILGAVVGAAAINALNELLRDFSEYQLIAYGIAIVLVVTVLPDGLVGGARRLGAAALARRPPARPDSPVSEATEAGP